MDWDQINILCVYVVIYESELAVYETISIWVILLYNETGIHFRLLGEFGLFIIL